LLVNAILIVSILASTQELSIEKTKVNPPEVAAFNGVAVSINKESLRNTDVHDTIVVRDFPLGMDASVTLRLQEFDVFAPDAQIVLASVNYLGDAIHRKKSKPDVRLLRGVIEGDPSSRVFLALGEHTTNGLIESDGSTYVLAKNNSAGWTAVYNLNDVDPEDMNWKDFYCDVVDSGNAIEQRRARSRNNVVGDDCQALRIAVETDWEFTELFGGSVDASGEYAVTLFGALSTIFEADMDVQTQISFLRIWNDDSDPWTMQTALDQLDQLRFYWEENMESVDRHLTHLLSGRNLGGGSAFLNGVCTYNGYAVSANLLGSFPLPLQDNHWNNWDVYAVAHQTGHNCGTDHTHNYSPPIDYCGIDCSDNLNFGTLMSVCNSCPGGMSNILLSFHPTVRLTIENYLFNVVACSLDCVETTLSGACCIGQTCSEVSEEECENSGGLFWGVGTVCLNNSCIPLHGACCLDDSGLCSDGINQSQCNEGGGMYLGNGTSCSLGWCDVSVPTACCLDDTCIDMLVYDCNEANGYPLGLGVFCSDNVCNAVDNDTCVNAREVGIGQWGFTTLGATSGNTPTDPQMCEPSFLGDVANDVWFKYQACESGVVEASTCGSADFDTDIVVYTLDEQSGCDNLNQHACNGDGELCGGFTSEIMFDVIENDFYLIRVGGFSSTAQGQGILSIIGNQCQQDIPCEGDLNGDGFVGVIDLLEVISHWNSTDPVDLEMYDLDGNGSIQLGDLLFIIGYWGCEFE